MTINERGAVVLDQSKPPLHATQTGGHHHDAPEQFTHLNHQGAVVVAAKEK